MTTPEDSELLHLRELVASLRREVQDLRAATEIVVKGKDGYFEATMVDDVNIWAGGSSARKAVCTLLVKSHSRFNIKITEIHE